ncbi:MAG: dUTP diphosphatase [Planctomycetota bacterium]|jgi:dUTP pyrophosphatase|nr:MAG: dUTP diphosphatase [Planctomycetota bacterium]RLS96422.1 MAG: dUTP diphosphatase [Planctomycetota bacterium]
MDAVLIEFRRLRAGAILPAYQSEQAAGMDLSADLDEPVEIEPGDIVVIPCGFAMALPIGFEAQIRPRSGLATKFGITLPNAPGTVDSDYRGEMKVPLINHGKIPFVVEPGMRIAQMIVARVEHVQILEVKELTQTQRGERGFGSTGVGHGPL